MKKRIIASLLAFLCLTSSAFAYEPTKEEKEATYKQLELFAEALSMIQKRHVEKKEPKDDIYGSLRGLLDSLDPYSSFMDPAEYKELLEETAGKFGGLGVEIAMRDKVLTVVSPVEGTPAWKAGLKPQDKIVKIEDKKTRDVELDDAVKLLRGDPGTKVKLTILREKENRIFSVTLTRAIIDVKDIRKAMILENEVGYVRIAEFRDNTARDLAKALGELSGKGMKGLIVDLRSNPGGLLDSAVDVASLFIPADKLVVYTLDRDGKKEDYLSTKQDKAQREIPMVVLVDDGSASGSEIVAGCMQDYKRAVILGVKSYGKASVQTVIPLSDGSALRLTTAKYYTPLGRLIHEKGIHPDIVVEPKLLDLDKPKKEDEIFEKADRLEKGVAESVADKSADKDAENDLDDEKNDPSFYKRDAQLIRAVDLVRGMIVVGKK